MAAAGPKNTGATNDPAPPRRPSLTLSSTAVFLAAVAIQLIGFFGSVFLYRNIGGTGSGKALIGTVQLYLLIGSSINAVADLRLGSAFVFFVARGKPPHESTGTYLILRTMMVGVTGLVLFVIGPMVIFGTQLASGSTEIAILGVFMAMPLLWSISTVYNQLWVAEGNSVKAQYPLLVEAIVRTPILIFVWYHDQTLWGMTIAYLVGATSSGVYSISAVVKRTGRFSFPEAKLMFRYAWPLMGSLILLYIVTNAIPLVVNAFLGTQALTIFLAANGFRILALSVPAAIAVPLFPYLSSLHKREQYELVRSGTWQALRYTAIVVVPGVMALVIYRVNFLFILFNKTYVGPGALPLAILAVSAIPLSLSQIIGTALNAIGRQRLELYLTSGQIVVLFAVIFLLLPPGNLLPPSDGIFSASVAVLASSCVALALNTYFMSRMMAVRIQIRPIVTVVLSAGLSFFAVSDFNDYFLVNRYYQLLAGVFVGYAVYLVVLALVGELSRRDVDQIAGALGIPQRLSNIFAWLCWRSEPPGVNPADLRQAAGLRPFELPQTFSGETELESVVPPDPDPPGGGPHG